MALSQLMVVIDIYIYISSGYLLHSHGIAMAHGNRCFTELNSMVIFHGYVSHNQRIYIYIPLNHHWITLNQHEITMFLGFLNPWWFSRLAITPTAAASTEKPKQRPRPRPQQWAGCSWESLRRQHRSPSPETICFFRILTKQNWIAKPSIIAKPSRNFWILTNQFLTNQNEIFSLPIYQWFIFHSYVNH